MKHSARPAILSVIVLISLLIPINSNASDNAASNNNNQQTEQQADEQVNPNDQIKEDGGREEEGNRCLIQNLADPGGLSGVYHTDIVPIPFTHPDSAHPLIDFDVLTPADCLNIEPVLHKGSGTVI